MTSIFDFLRQVEQRPSMYLGYMNNQREEQLSSLEFVIMGYTCAIQQHQLVEPTLNFREDFGNFLRQKYGWSMSTGPIGAVLREYSDKETSWKVFWTHVWEFERSLMAH
ncbi:hypothetical protein [Myxococcus sp. CA039A]|uniref:hypothetical protein n=1 Tax=Myxococcus sp. CA039A TaxID=2741737 RepID=UPI00157B6BBF|nr:hypothetical protein [Myxococcus sp. CA039A]NTX51807.1 hypothetical protein [Myxococcus sp. CA039A]